MNRGVVVWFTGLPCSGKTTIAKEVKKFLEEKGIDVELLDGDTVRDYIRNKDFSKEGRNKHLRYIALMAKLLAQRGVVVLCSFVSPYRENRDFARSISENFVEIYVNTPLEVCIQRDVKGMYKKALNGEIKGFTGVDDPYEEPENPELVIETQKESVEESASKVISKLKELGYLKA
ncbi:MAG: adenylyl-sulfate kinase [Thermoplasmata archaeon]|nr:MAG: adenylyl-sulfate kinase [Thermoplasmata archaeon]KAA0009214.1 MAG: adenylyl-sulfate kinase [Thermoplasmata archaeon]MCD6573579.1 adenylyl-sulfate kinase [Thermoplasmata archaeon]